MQDGRMRMNAQIPLGKSRDKIKKRKSKNQLAQLNKLGNYRDRDGNDSDDSFFDSAKAWKPNGNYL